MPEILTESFCERCGTRYTFESAAPKARLGRFKTLSKGLKNFVLDDATSLDEALASARSDESRESTAQQLDAFHKTFNFCMSCRQYTCPNCWNEAEGQCQSCSPMGLSPAWSRGDASAPPAWPTAPAEPAGIEAVAWPTADRRPFAADPTPDEVPWPLAALEGRVPAVEPEAEAEPEPVFEAEPGPEPVVWEQPVVMAEAEPTDPDASLTDIQKRAAAAASNTSDLLAKFRPGQSLDDALAAYEAAVDEAPPAAQPEPVAAAEPEPEPVTWAQPEPVAEPEPEPIAWPQAEPSPVPWPEAEPEPVAAMAAEPVAEPEPEPEPVVWEQPEPEQPEDEPISSPWLRPARPAQDIVEVPTWTFTAPDAPANGHPAEALSPAARTERPAPEWPSQPAESFLAARLAARKAGDDMWAASSAEVLGPAATAGPAAPAGVQACVSCGLSLSATARFCRRCGTKQG